MKYWHLGILVAAVVIAFLLWPRQRGAGRESVVSKPTSVRPWSSPSPAKRAAYVAGRVTGIDSGVLSGAIVCAFAVGAAAGWPSCASADRDGRYRITVQGAGRYDVTASALGYLSSRRGQRVVEIALAATAADVDFTLEKGGVEVEGSVVDIGGGPVAGSIVTMRRDSSGATAVSDQAGRFRLTVPPGLVTLDARAHGYVEGEALTASPATGVEIQLTPASTLRGVVVLAGSERPLPGARVELAEHWAEAVTDARGQFEIDALAPGRYRARASAEGLYGQAPSTRLGLAETSEIVRIEVHPVASVSGQVLVRPSGRSCTSGRVSLRRGSDADAEGPLAALTQDVDAGGRVRFDAVLAGDYEVEVECDGGFPLDKYPRLSVAREQKVEAVRWHVVEGNHRIRGRVVDRDGRGVAGAVINVYEHGPSAKSDAAGRFEVEGLLAGEYVVLAHHDEFYNRPESTVEVPLADDLEFVLVPGATLAGTVVDGAGRPAMNAVVSLTTKTASSHTTPSGRVITTTGQIEAGIGKVERGGTFESTGLDPGEHTVSASFGWWSESDDTAGKKRGQPVRLVAGQTTRVALRLDRFSGQLRGRVVDEHGGPVADAFVQVDRPGGSAIRFRLQGGVLSDTDGRFELDGLPEGPVVVRAYRRGGGEARALARDGQEVELEISDSAALGGRALADGTAPPWLVVELDGPMSRTDTFFRTNGSWSLGGLSPGRYLVSVRYQGRSGSQEVQLADGEQRLDLSLQLSEP